MRRLSDFSTPCRFWRGLISPSLPSAPSTFGAIKATASPPVTARVVITALLILVFRIRALTAFSISPIYLAYPRMNKSPIGQLFILSLFHYLCKKKGGVVMTCRLGRQPVDHPGASLAEHPNINTLARKNRPCEAVFSLGI